MIKKLSIAFIAFGILSLAGSVFAAEIDLVYSPPCLLQDSGTFGPCAEASSSIAQYLVNIYRFGLGIAGILAVGMIVTGAIYMTVSSSSVDKKSEGRDMITNALIGVALLFGSYILLNTINPELITLKDPAVKMLTIASSSLYTGEDIPVRGVTGCPDTFAASCSEQGLVAFTKYNTSTYRAAENTQICASTNDPNINPATGYVQCLPESITNDRYSFCSAGARITSQAYLDDCMAVDESKLNLKNIDGQFNIKSTNTCQWGTAPRSGCTVDAAFYDKLVALRDALAQKGIEGKDWMITEAFPPNVHHQSSCHLNGKCVDITYIKTPPVIPTTNATQAANAAADYQAFICKGVNEIVSVAKGLGLKVLNEYSNCANSTTFETTTGNNIHIELL